MNEKFLNFNCAQMAAVVMWSYLSSFKHHCNIGYRGKNCNIHVEVYLNAEDDIIIPQGYIYTSKEIEHFEGTDKVPDFKIVTYTFEY